MDKREAARVLQRGGARGRAAEEHLQQILCLEVVNVSLHVRICKRKAFLQARMFERTEEHSDDLPVPKIAGETLKVVAAIPEERSSKRIMAQRVDVHVPNVADKILDVAKAILLERSSERIVA